MPMVGMASLRVISAPISSTTPSMTTQNAPAASTAWASSISRGHSLRSRPLIFGPPRARTDWGKSPIWPMTGIARSVRKAIVGAMRAPALDLHAVGPRLLQHPRRIEIGLLRRGFVAAERHIDAHQRLGQGAHHRFGVVDHIVEGHRQRRFVPENDIGDAVADENEVGHLVDELRHRRGVSGEADKRFAALSGADFGDALPGTQL